MSELLFIAVPGGAVRPDGLAPLAVVVVPRLSGGGGDLASHGMDRWPELLHSTRFTVSFRGQGEGQPVTPQPGIDASEMLEHWQTMFPADTPVRPYVTPPERDVDILETTTHVKDIRALYRQEVAGQPPPDAAFDEGLADQVPFLTAADVVPSEGRFARAAPPPPAAVRARARKPEERPKPDFHERVAYLREHPAVLRALGLIIDFALPVSDDVTAITISGALPAWPAGPAPTPRAAWTMCSLRRARFLPQPRPGSGLVDGLVELGGARVLDPGDDKPDWAIVTFDVDAAMTRLASVTDVAPETPGSLPGLRSAGLAVIRGGRRDELLDRTGRKDPARRGAVHDTDLFAEDLVLGYRLDVRHLRAEWTSLCGRRATYTLGKRRLGDAETITEESHVKADAMISSGDPDAPLSGDEIVVRWDGWSLAVPRPHPGRDRSPSADSPLHWDFSPDAPLPRLRFGTDYRLRARVADLAGGGLTVGDLAGDDPDDVQETNTISYGRVEPIPAPVVTYPAPREHQLGAGLERLVIRSPGGPGHEVGSARDEFRLLSPPPVSVELADQHGVFDEHPVDSGASWDLARRAMVGIDDGDDPGADPVAGQPVGWLPDPLAAQWVLWKLDDGQRRSGRWEHAAAAVADAPRTWSAAPVRLDLKPGATFDWAESQDVVAVSLGLGEQVELRLSSSPDESFRPEELLLHRWVEPASAGRVLDDVREGRHAHITPARTLHLVHAVERPLTAPVVPLKAERASHDTFVLLKPDGAMSLDRASTVQLDLAASWVEVGLRGDRRPKAAIIASETVPLDHDAWEFGEKRQEFADTRHRRVDYELTATSRFKEYFDVEGRSPGDFTTIGPRVEVEVPSSARPPEPEIRQTLPAFFWEGPAPAPGWMEWKRTRRAGLLRVHMGPLWFHTGEGEQLAVIATPQKFPPRRLWGLLSQAGRDPIRETDNPRRWVTGEDLPAFGVPPVDIWAEEAQTELPLVAYEPSWASDIGADGGWIADIDLGPLAESSYCPFVRLAVARYQPESLDRLHLSPIVLTDIVQLLPNRELTVSHGFSSSVSVRLEGLGPRRKINRVDVELQRWSGPPDLAAQPQSDLITTAPVSDLPAWTPTGSAVTGALGEEITLPVEPSLLVDPTWPVRVLIREVEDLRAAPTDGMGADMLRQRTVFVEAVPLWNWLPVDPPAGGE